MGFAVERGRLDPKIDDFRPGQPPGIRISFGALKFDLGEGLGGSFEVVFVDLWWIRLVFGDVFWPY
jgi:hypothetical protein